MQPEAQVILREFNRRLRTALSSAPNHVRVEAALEVESHVLDVLSRHKSELSEPEQVAEILAGFGTPEGYARAITSQLPGVQVVDVHTGLREVGLAAYDLVRGTGRLTIALLLHLVAFVVTIMHWLRVGAGWVFSKLRWAAREARTPIGRSVTWVLRRANQVRRGGHVLRLWMGRRAHDLIKASRGAISVGAVVLRWGVLSLRWALKAATFVTFAGLALAAFAIAAFAAFAPDVVGFIFWELQTGVDAWIREVRQVTVGRVEPALQPQFAHTGNTVLVSAILFGVLLLGLIALMVWNTRRRRSQVADQQL